MRVALSTYRDVEPMLRFAVHSQAHGAQMRACAAPHIAELLDNVAVFPVPTGAGL